MPMKPLTILTGSNRAAEPSSGSLILVNDLYPAMPDTRTIYLGRRTVDQEWRSAFDRLVPISTKKRPLGPGFDAYVDELTQEVGALIEQVRRTPSTHRTSGSHSAWPSAAPPAPSQ